MNSNVVIPFLALGECNAGKDVQMQEWTDMSLWKNESGSLTSSAETEKCRLRLDRGPVGQLSWAVSGLLTSTPPRTIKVGRRPGLVRWASTPTRMGNTWWAAILTQTTSTVKRKARYALCYALECNCFLHHSACDWLLFAPILMPMILLEWSHGLPVEIWSRHGALMGKQPKCLRRFVHLYQRHCQQSGLSHHTARACA